MNATCSGTRQRSDHAPDWQAIIGAATALTLSAYKQTNGQRIIRLYLCHPHIGTLVSIEDNGVCYPCYPGRNNYPIKGRWYGSHKWKTMDWREALCRAISPPDQDPWATAHGPAPRDREPFFSAIVLSLCKSSSPSPSITLSPSAS